MPLKERILVAGAPGTGKTFGWACLARALPQHKFHIIDPDDGVRRVLYEVDEETKERVFPDLSNIVYYFTPKWYANGVENVGKSASIIKLNDPGLESYQTGVADAWKIIQPKVKPEDWIVVEHLGNLWARVQDGFADEVFEKDIGQYFLEKRKAMKQGAKKLEALEGWTDWSVINKLHNDDFIVSICFESPAHVYMTTAFSIVEPRAREEAQLKAFYGETSIRLEGQKHNPFRAQTILMFKASGSQDSRNFHMNTFLKDRGRPWAVEAELTDLYYDYLVLIAGWS